MTARGGFLTSMIASFQLENHHWRGMAKLVLIASAALLALDAYVFWEYGGDEHASGLEIATGATMMAYFLSWAHPLVDSFFGVTRHWRDGSASLLLTVPAPRTSILVGKGLAVWLRFIVLQAFALVVTLGLGVGMALRQPHILWLLGLFANGEGVPQVLYYWWGVAVPLSALMAALAPAWIAGGQLLALIIMWFNRRPVSWLVVAGLLVLVFGVGVADWGAAMRVVEVGSDRVPVLMDPLARSLHLPAWSVSLFEALKTLGGRVVRVSVWIFAEIWAAAVIAALASSAIFAGRVDARPLARS